MSISQTTPDKAKEILDNNPDATYLDVRSVPEFIQGHPEGALNIPLMHINLESRQMEPNQDFAKVCQEVLNPQMTYVVGCKTGGRSQKACDLLSALGYEKLFNVNGGFSGNDEQKGWKDLDLPVSDDNGEGVSYESLAKAASS